MRIETLSAASAIALFGPVTSALAADIAAERRGEPTSELWSHLQGQFGDVHFRIAEVLTPGGWVDAMEAITGDFVAALRAPGETLRFTIRDDRAAVPAGYVRPTQLQLAL